MAEPASIPAAAAGAESHEVNIPESDLDAIKEEALMGRFLWKEMSIVAVTAVFSILATITVAALTGTPTLTEHDVTRLIDQQSLSRTEIVELLDDKALTRKDKEDIYSRLRTLEQQYTRIETKLDLLLSRTALSGDNNP